VQNDTESPGTQGFARLGEGISHEAVAQTGRRGLPPFDLWPSVDEAGLPEDRQAKFLVRRAALKLYMAGTKLQEISAQTGLSVGFIHRLLRKASQLHSDGRIWGLRAAIPWIRVASGDNWTYSAAPGDTTWSGPGAFSALLARHPTLDRFIRDHVLKRGRSHAIYESRERVIDLHRAFLRKCRELGLNPITDYPFSAKTAGYVSLAAYVRDILSEPTARAVFIKYGEAGLKNMRTGDGSQRPVQFPYERVECDAHHIDALFCILFPDLHGAVIPLILPRLWVIAIKEIESRAILGYYLSLNKECTEEDLLRCIQNALTPWTPRQLSDSHLRYAEGAGFPSALNELFAGACWDEFSVDGAKINLSKRVATKLDSIVGASVVLLPRRIPNDRPFIERFFGTLEEEGFHRLPNTTGSHPSDIRRYFPEVAACKYFIQLEDLENLLDVLIANYNAAIHSSLNGRSPLQYLEWSRAHPSDGWRLRHATPEAIRRIGATHSSAIIRGGNGRRPYVTFQYGTYSCPAFSHAQQLVGKRLTIDSYSDDARVIYAYLPDGQELGPLTVAPPWSRQPHTFAMRRLIKARVRAKNWHQEDFEDPITALLLDLENRVRKTHVVTSEYMELRRYLLEQRSKFRATSDENYEAALQSGQPTISSPVERDGSPRHIETKQVTVSELIPRMARQRTD